MADDLSDLQVSKPGLGSQLMRSAGLAIRPYGPAATVAAAGGLGGQALGVPAPVGAGAGLLAYGLSKLVNDYGIRPAYNAFKNPETPEWQTTEQMVEPLLDKVFPKPDPNIASERVANAMNQGIADSLTLTGVGAIPGVAKTAAASLPFLRNSPVAAGVAQAVSEAPATQAVLSAAAAPAFDAVQQAAPDNPLAQTAASVAIPLAVGGVKTPWFSIPGAYDLARAPINYYGKGTLGNFFTGRDANGTVMPRREAAARGFAENQVAQRLQEAAGTPSQLADSVANLFDAERLSTGGYKPTTGTLSANPNLIALEKGLANNASFRGTDNSTMLSRYDDNLKAITGGVNNVVAQSGASPAAAQSFLGNLLAGQERAAQNAVSAGQAAAARGEQALAGAQAPVNAMASDVVRNEASKAVRASLDKNYDAYRRQAAELKSAIPLDDPSLNVDVSGARNEANKFVQEAAGTSGEYAFDHPINRFLNATESGVMSPQKADYELSHLFSVKQGLPKNSPEERAIGFVRDALDSDVSKVEPLSEPLGQFRTFYRDELAPRFKQGASETALNRRGPGGADAVAPENTIAPYMGTESEAARLKSALTGTASELPAPDAKSIRDWTLSKMASEVGENPTGTKIRNWIAQNESVLNQFPEVKSEAQRMANRIGGAAQFKDKMAADLADRQASLKATQQENAGSNIAKFAQGGPESAVAQVDSFLYGNRASEQMAELRRQAERDPTGQAMQGLQNAVKESLSRRLRSKTNAVGGDNSVSPAESENFSSTVAKMNGVLSQGPTRKALAEVFPKEDLSALDQVRKQIEVSNRINRQATAGSQTQPNSSGDEFANAIRRGTWTLNVVKYGKVLGSALDIGNAVARGLVMKNPEQVAKQLFTDAMTDPYLARVLLQKPTNDSLPKLKQALTPWLNSYIHPSGSQQDDDLSDLAVSNGPEDLSDLAVPAKSRSKRLLGE